MLREPGDMGLSGESWAGGDEDVCDRAQVHEMRRWSRGYDGGQCHWQK
jgi:hypothetical protein